MQIEVLLRLELGCLVDLGLDDHRLLVTDAVLAHRAFGVDLDHHVSSLAKEAVSPFDALVSEVVGLDAVVLRGHQDRLLERGTGEEFAGRFAHRFLTRAARSFLAAGAPTAGAVSGPPRYPALFRR